VPRSRSDEAIVLRAWSVGETDRFCLLLTKEHGRIAVRVPGARRMLSRRGRGLLPLHIVHITWTEKDAVHMVTDSACTEPNPDAWSSIEALTTAEQGIDLVVRLTEEGESLPEVYALAAEYLQLCTQHSPALFTLFTVKLLRLLGTFPSATHSIVSGQRFSAEDSIVWDENKHGFCLSSDHFYGITLAPAVHQMLCSIDSLPLKHALTFSEDTAALLSRIAHSCVPIQLGTSFASFAGATPSRMRSSSLAVTPI